MNMAHEERAKVVEWLRETQAIFERQQRAGEKPLVARHHADSCRWAAEAIANGEHWMVSH